MSIRFGLVSQLDPAKHRARVRFPAEDLDTTTEEPGMETYWLPVLVQWSLGAKAYCMPSVGEQVAVWLDDEAADGVVLGAIYNSADAPPSAPATARRIEFDDGTVVEYDPAASKLRAQVFGEVEITATGKIKAMGMDGLDFAGAGPVTLTGLDTMSVSASGTMTIEAFDGLVVNAYANAMINAEALVTVAAPAIALAAAVAVTIAAPAITLTGAIVLDGTVSATGAVNAVGVITSLATVNAIGGTTKAGAPYNFP